MNVDARAHGMRLQPVKDENVKSNPPRERHDYG
jgi:hypothetical protein